MAESLALRQLAEVQPQAAEFFGRVLRSGKLSHAYLFKAHPWLARPVVTALAQALFCPQQGCLHCPVCQAVARESWPDLHFIRTAPEAKSPVLKLAQIKQLIAQVALPPVQSALQIFVLEQAEHMNTESGNALLKTLEEPATPSLFILVSAYPSKVLPTLRSRSQQILLRIPPQGIERLAEGKLWHWDQLEQITHLEAQLALYRYLEGLDRQTLMLQFQLFQTECWQRLRTFLQQKPSPALLKRARAYLDLFEQVLETASAYGNTRLALEFFCQDFVLLRRQQLRRHHNSSDPITA